jgi:hypothetical protein
MPGDPPPASPSAEDAVAQEKARQVLVDAATEAAKAAAAAQERVRAA